jgi:hypothetical protein
MPGPPWKGTLSPGKTLAPEQISQAQFIAETTLREAARHFQSRAAR